MMEKTTPYSEPSPPYYEANPYLLIPSESQFIKLWSESRDLREEELKNQLQLAGTRFTRAYFEQSMYMLCTLLFMVTILAFGYSHDIQARQQQCQACIETVLQGNLTSMPPCAKII